MELVKTIEDLRVRLDKSRSQGSSVGFVPTMGALHEGHLSLARLAAHQCDVVVMSIFVNPLQFAPHEDLDVYPRSIERDIELAASVGVEYLFVPSVDEMYPDGDLETRVSVSGVSELYEGGSRPGHFDGVATVVTKLFSIVGNCRAYFGEKDWQQLAVVSQMAKDLSLPVDVVPCSIVRDVDGLALSSRNIYLSDDERVAALLLSKSLRVGVDEIANGGVDLKQIKQSMLDVLQSDPLVVVNYVDIVDKRMRPASSLSESNRIVVSANVGKTHLIDNIGVPS